MRYPNGYRPPRRVVRSIWPRVVIGLLAAAAWAIVIMVGILIGRVVSMIR